MTVEEILTVVRGLLDDKKGAGTPLWSDTELVEYANEAESRIAEECLVLRDAVTATDSDDLPVCVIPIATPYTNTFTLHPSILKVHSVSYGTSRKALTSTSMEALDQSVPTWRTKTGEPGAYAVDITTGQLDIDRVPTAASNLYLSVSRMPLTEMSRTNLKASPSIPRMYHRKLVNGIVARAYQKQDVETMNLDKSRLFGDKFDRDVEQIKRNEIRFNRRDRTCLRRFY